MSVNDESCVDETRVWRTRIDYLSRIWHNFWEFWMLYALQLCIVWLYNYFDMNVTDESCVDETRVWRTKLESWYFL